jgi:hypothetical protein
MFPSFQRGGNQPQQPTDALIQQYINDAASLLIAVLTRRFSESIYAVPGNNLSLWAASLGLPNYSWVASSAVAVGVVLVDENTPPGAWKATTAGTSGAGVPNWPIGAGIGVTQADNTVTWTNIGQSAQFQVLEAANRYRAAFQLGFVLATFGGSTAILDLAKHYDEEDWQRLWNELNAVDKNGKPMRNGAFDVLFDAQANVASPRPGLVYVAGGDQPSYNTPSNEGISNMLGKFGIDYGRHRGAGPGWGNEYAN